MEGADGFTEPWRHPNVFDVVFHTLTDFASIFFAQFQVNHFSLPT